MFDPDLFHTFSDRSYKKLLWLNKAIKHVTSEGRTASFLASSSLRKNLTLDRHAKLPCHQNNKKSIKSFGYVSKQWPEPGQLSENNFQLLGTQLELPLLLKSLLSFADAIPFLRTCAVAGVPYFFFIYSTLFFQEVELTIIEISCNFFNFTEGCIVYNSTLYSWTPLNGRATNLEKTATPLKHFITYLKKLPYYLLLSFFFVSMCEILCN